MSEAISPAAPAVNRPTRRQWLTLLVLSLGLAIVIIDGTIVNVVRNRSFDVRFTGTRTITQHFERKGAAYVRAPHAGNEMDNNAIPTC